MLVTSKEANNMLKELMDEKEKLLQIEAADCKFLAAVGEDPETLRPEYDFYATNSNIEAIDVEIINLKHKINVFNSTTMVGDTGLTIDQVLIKMPQLNARKRTLNTMRMYPKKIRRSIIGNVIDYQYANFDPNEAGALYEETSKILTSLQEQLDLVNSTIKFEI